MIMRAGSGHQPPRKMGFIEFYTFNQIPTTPQSLTNPWKKTEKGPL
jgi:hypothetical protein